MKRRKKWEKMKRKTWHGEESARCFAARHEEGHVEKKGLGKCNTQSTSSKIMCIFANNPTKGGVS